MADTSTPACRSALRTPPSRACSACGSRQERRRNSLVRGERGRSPRAPHPNEDPPKSSYAPTRRAAHVHGELEAAVAPVLVDRVADVCEGAIRLGKPEVEP